MSKFEEIYKKVLDADKKYKELNIPIHLDFKIEDFRDALIESNDKIEKLKAENKRLEEIKDKYKSCAEKAIDKIAKCELKIRSLSRALYKALANWASIMKFYDDDLFIQWDRMETKCREKAKVFE